MLRRSSAVPFWAQSAGRKAECGRLDARRDDGWLSEVSGPIGLSRTFSAPLLPSVCSAGRESVFGSVFLCWGPEIDGPWFVSPAPSREGCPAGARGESDPCPCWRWRCRWRARGAASRTHPSPPRQPWVDAFSCRPLPHLGDMPPDMRRFSARRPTSVSQPGPERSHFPSPSVVCTDRTMHQRKGAGASQTPPIYRDARACVRACVRARLHRSG